MFFQNINYWIVVISALAGMIIVFISMQGQKSTNKTSASAWITMTLFTLVSALVLAVLFNSLVITSISGMFLIAISLWAGFILPVKLNDYLFHGQPLFSFFVVIGYQLLSVTIMSLIIGILG